MVVDISATIRAIGESDIRAAGLDPHQGPLDEWRAARIKRGCSVNQLITRENKHIARPRMSTLRPGRETKPKCKGRTPESRKASAALISSIRHANYEMWANEMETRDGLCSMNRVDTLMHRKHETTRNVARAGLIPVVMVACPPLGREVKMVRLQDVRRVAEGS